MFQWSHAVPIETVQTAVCVCVCLGLGSGRSWGGGLERKSPSAVTWSMVLTH